MKDLLDLSLAELTLMFQGVLVATSGANYTDEQLLNLSGTVVSKKPVFYTAFVSLVAGAANYGIMGPDPNSFLGNSVVYLGYVDHSIVKNNAVASPTADQVILRGFVGSSSIASNTVWNKTFKFNPAAAPENIQGPDIQTPIMFQAWRADVILGAGITGTYCFNFKGLQCDLSGNA